MVQHAHHFRAGSISVRKEGGESGEDKDSGAPVDKSKLEKQLKDLKETESSCGSMSGQ